MRKILFVSVINFLFTCILFSQTTEIEDAFMSSVNELYSLNYLGGANNGRGNAGIGTTQDISGVLMNPAGLEIKKKQQANFQYTYKTKQKWEYRSGFDDFDYTTEHIVPSVYLAYCLKLNKNISAGFIYSNPVSAKYDFLNILTSNGEGNIYVRYNVHSFNVPASYNFGKFRAGINISYSLYRTFLHGVTTEIEPETSHDALSSFWRLNAQAGLLFTPSEMFSFGISFTPGFKAYPKSDLEPVSTNIRIVSKFPMKFGAGIKVMAIKNKLNLFLDYNYSQTSEITGYHDKHDFNIGADYILNKNVILKAGAFTFLDNRDFTDSRVIFLHPEGEYEQIFVTVGAAAKFKNVELNASIIDSHLSKGFIKNTYLNFGAVLNF